MSAISPPKCLQCGARHLQRDGCDFRKLLRIATAPAPKVKKKAKKNGRKGHG